MNEKQDSKQGRKVSRRTVFKTVGVGGAAAAVAPQILIAGEDKSGMKSKLMGQGEHTYEWVEGWAKTPDSIRFGYTHGVAEDSQGNIYIHNQSKDSMAVFDPDGKFIKSWGEAFAAGAHGLTLNKEGSDEFLYLADVDRNIVVKTTLDGEEIWTLGLPEESGVYPEGKGYKPTNVAIGPNGDVYIADGYGSSYIHQYNKDAEYIRTWGGKGTEDGKLSCPHGIWLDTRGETPEILVADRANVRLQWFSLEGEHLRTHNKDLLHPCHFDIRESDLLVPDLFGRVSIFDKNNNLVTHLGITPGVKQIEGYPNLPHEQRHVGQFISPHSAMWDKDGNIFVVEWINDGRVTKLRRVS
jgi:DNA-binding beta-propeller fold protein YncE